MDVNDVSNYRCILAKNGARQYYFGKAKIKKEDIPASILASLLCSQKGEALVSERAQAFEKLKTGLPGLQKKTERLEKKLEAAEAKKVKKPPSSGKKPPSSGKDTSIEEDVISEHPPTPPPRAARKPPTPPPRMQKAGSPKRSPSKKSPSKKSPKRSPKKLSIKDLANDSAWLAFVAKKYLDTLSEAQKESLLKSYTSTL